MKRSRIGRRSGLPREAEELLWLCSGLAESGSHAEDRFWEVRLRRAVDELLAGGNEDVLTTTLDHVYTTNPRAYDELADAIEAQSESGLHAEGEILLIAAPWLAWSRFSIPASVIPPKVVDSLRVHLSAHVLASNTKLGLADVLFSPDQLPQGYCETARFTSELARAAAKGENMRIDAQTLPETSRFLSDIRYVLGVVVVRAGEPIFRWQERDGTREQAAAQWRAQGGACLAPMLTGCATELVLPDAYFAACRQADRASRPYSVGASTAFLSSTLDVSPGDLRAVVAPFHEQQLEEYRIGFTLDGQSDVVHGVVWPLLGLEDDNSDVPAQIENALKESGITHIQHLDSPFALEYCEDCGAPMYPSPEGEAVHAELPEEKMEQVPKHLH